MKKSIIAILVSTASLGFGASNAFAGLTLNVNQDGTFAEEGTWKEGGYNNGLRNPYCKDNVVTGASADGCTQNHKNDDVVYWGEMQGIVSDIKTTGTFVNWNYDKVKEARADIVEINKKLDTATAVGKEVYDNRSLLLNRGEQIINNQIDSSINNIISGGNTEINGVINNAKETANDFDARITANKNRIDDQATRIGKVEDKSEANRKDIVSINKETKRLDNVKADKADLVDLEGKVDGAIADGTQAIANINGRIDNAKTAVINGGKLAYEHKGDITNAIGDKVTNVINGDTNISNAIDGKINAKVDQLGADLTARIERDEAAGIAEANRLEDKKADKADLENLVNNINDAVDNAKAVGIKAGKVVLSHAGDIKAGADTYIDNRTDAAIAANNTVIRNEGDKMYNDLQAQIDASVGEKNEDLTQIRADITANAGEIVRLDNQKADKADLDKAISDGTDAYNNVNGRIDNIKGNVTNAVVSIGNGIRDNKEEITNVVNGKINSVVDNSITNLVGDSTTNVGIAIEGAKTDLRQLNARMDYAEGDIAEMMVKGNTAKDQLTNDINDVNDRIDNIKSNVRTAAGKIVANKDIIINKGQEAVDKGVTYVNNKITESIVNGDNVLANEINNQINAKFEKQGEDFTNRINAEVARGEAAADKGAEELANLNNSLAETNSYIDRQVVRGETAYRVTSTRIDNGYAVGEATRDDLQRQIDELDGKTLNEGDVNTIINNAGKEVAIKVGKGLVDNSTNITEGAKNVINAEINKKVEAGKNLAIQKGKEVVTNVQAKLPAVQGEIVKKAADAKTYVNNINAKADTAISMGNENAQNIITERNDRIQGQRDTLKAANSYTDNKFSSLKNQVESNRRKAAAGTAGVAAMTNIPALTGDANGSFGMGLGHYDGAQSISAGVQQRFNQNVIGKASFASDDHGNVVVGFGASVQW